jgi:hypothetical protein
VAAPIPELAPVTSTRLEPLSVLTIEP